LEADNVETSTPIQDSGWILVNWRDWFFSNPEMLKALVATTFNVIAT
jgi:hypothetical protein